jgi:hypothetical protein
MKELEYQFDPWKNQNTSLLYGMNQNTRLLHGGTRIPGNYMEGPEYTRKPGYYRGGGDQNTRLLQGEARIPGCYTEGQENPAATGKD